METRRMVVIRIRKNWKYLGIMKDGLENLTFTRHIDVKGSSRDLSNLRKWMVEKGQVVTKDF